MHRSSLRGRVAPLALAALVLGMPAAAVAETVPSPSGSASASSVAPSTTASASPTATSRAAAGLPPAAGTSWTEGVCAPDADGVTAVVDLQGSAGAVARCVTSTGGAAYASTNSLQTFADAGFDVATKATGFGPQVCQVDGAPSTDPCAAWTGVWWSFWTGTDAGWKQAVTGAHETAAPTGSFVALSLVDGDVEGTTPAPAPRVDTTPATSTPTPTPTPTVSTTPTPGPSTPAGPGRADLASDWLVSRSLQDDGTYDLQSFGFNPGLMIDMLFALVAEDPDHEAIPGLWASIEKQIPEWVDFTAGDGTRYVDGPSAAKAMLAAEAVRDDVHDVGGLDVAETLESKIDDDGKVLDYGDAPAYGFGQTLAVLALARADALDTTVLDAMLAQQCPAGGFRLSHGTTACADDTASGVDATAMGLQAMLAAERSGVDVADTHLTRAVGYLTSAAKPSGGWANDAFTTTVNTNSTGLAVQALQAWLDEHPGSAAAESAITKGRAWVAGLQVLPATGAAAVTNVGAIAYSPEAFAAGPATSTDQWERATPQAMLAFGLPGFDTLVVAAAPTTPTPTPTTSASSSATPTGGTTTPTTPGTGGSGAGSGEGSGGAPTDSASGEGLAYTGASVWPALAVAVLLLLAGAGFVLVSRRRGVHA